MNNRSRTFVPAMRRDNETTGPRVSFPTALTDREQYEKINTLNKNGRAYIDFYIETKFYYQTTNVYSDCNTINFVNLGVNTVLINGFPLTQGQQLTIEGNYMEIDKTQYQIEFSTSISTDNNLAVLRKLYK